MLETIFQGPSGIRSGWRLLLFLFLTAIPLFTLQGLLADIVRRSNLADGLTPSIVFASEGLDFLCALLAAWILGLVEQKKLGDYGLPARGAFGRNFWLGAVVGFVAFSFLLLGIHLGHGFYLGAAALGARGIFYFSIMWAIAFLTLAFAEEFLFRGYALATLADGIGFWPAAIVLSLVFGAVHLSNIGENPTGALSVAAVGLLFCFTYRRTGNLWFAIGLHAAWDYSESFIFSVPDSGIVAQGRLLNSHLRAGAPAWLTGGSVGPEGSIFVLIVLAVLFVVVDRMYPEVKFPVSPVKAELKTVPEAGGVFGGPETRPEGECYGTEDR